MITFFNRNQWACWLGLAVCILIVGAIEHADMVTQGLQ